MCCVVIVDYSYVMSYKKKMHKEYERKYYNCCVLRCPNTTWNSRWTFFSLPSNLERRKVWLNLIERDDLNAKLSDHHRVCEEHFDTDSILISPNRKCLKKDCVPENLLPDTKYKAKHTQGIASYNDKFESITGFSKRTLKSTVSSIESGQLEEGYYCNRCSNAIYGFRYVCIQCPDFDLCNDCEAKGEHAQHYMLRVPGERSQEEIAFVLEKIREELFNNDNIAKCLKIEIKEEPDEDPLTVNKELNFEMSPTPESQLGPRSKVETGDVNYTPTSDIARKRKRIKSKQASTIIQSNEEQRCTPKKVREEPSFVQIHETTSQLCKATKQADSESISSLAENNTSISTTIIEAKQLTSPLCKDTMPAQSELITVLSQNKPSNSTYGTALVVPTFQLTAPTLTTMTESMSVTPQNRTTSIPGT